MVVAGGAHDGGPALLARVASAPGCRLSLVQGRQVLVVRRALLPFRRCCCLGSGSAVLVSRRSNRARNGTSGHTRQAVWSVVTPQQRRDRQLTRCRMCHPACVPPVPEIPHAPGGGTAGSAARAPPVLSASCSSCRHPRPPVPPSCASQQRPGRGRTGPGPPLSTGGEPDRGQGLRALSTVRGAQLRRRRTRLLRATRASRSSSYAVSWAPAMMPAAAAEARSANHLLLARVGIVPRHPSACTECPHCHVIRFSIYFAPAQASEGEEEVSVRRRRCVAPWRAPCTTPR